MLLTAHRDGKTKVTSWFSFFSVLPFHPVSLLCLLIFTHSLISCRDFNMLDAEKIPVIWEYAIKYMRDCLCDLWYFYEYIIGSWEQVFFTNSPNMCAAKLKREWFDSTYIAFISELPFILCNQTPQLFEYSLVSLLSLFYIRRAYKCIILFIGGVSVTSWGRISFPFQWC